MKKLDITTKTTKNGLKVVLVNLPTFHTVTNFLAVRSGSRYEDSSNNGIAHFLEHMVFKGTDKYADTAEIAQAIESIGGYFNAWTSVDHTCYWNTVPESVWQVGAEMTVELAYKAKLDVKDLDRERGVIIEEIRRIQDDPASYVDDLSGQVLFAGNPLAQPIIGNEKNIKNMTIEQFKEYRQSHYSLKQSIFIAIGDLSDKDVVGEIEGLTANLPSVNQSVFEAVSAPSQKALKLLSKKTDQTHFVLGVAHPDLSMKNDRSYVGEVLNTILGRGMSSRLFLNVREQRGLAYSIHSSISTLEDTGAITIYGGINVDKIDEALQATKEELVKLQQEPVGEVELEKAKAYICGSYDIRADEPIELAKWYGLGTLLHKYETFEEAKEKISQVTAEQVQELAREAFDDERLTLALIGPYEEDQRFKDFLKII